MKARTGSAITKPRFTWEELALGVVRDMLEGRRDSEKILVGETANSSPLVVGKWQLYRMDSRTAFRRSGNCFSSLLLTRSTYSLPGRSGCL